MGSRALLVRCINQLVNNSKQCKNFLSSSAVCNEKKESDNLTVSKSSSALTEVGIPRKDMFQQERVKQGYITIESEVNAVGLAAGIPEEHIKTRTVYIAKPTKNAMQSGTNNTHGWQICFDTRERWENPLMGWCSSGDPMQALRVHFDTLEGATQHCKSMGWRYIVEKPNTIVPKPRSYGDNFSWNRNTRVSTK